MMLERYPNLKKEVGGSIPGCEISSLLEGKLAKWLIASYALVLPCRPSVSKKKKKKERKKERKKESGDDSIRKHIHKRCH
jgi:hypothetical protein